MLAPVAQQDHNAKATFFLCTNYVEGFETEARHLLDDGHEFANHCPAAQLEAIAGQWDTGKNRHCASACFTHWCSVFSAPCFYWCSVSFTTASRYWGKQGMLSKNTAHCVYVPFASARSACKLRCEQPERSEANATVLICSMLHSGAIIQMP